MNAEVADRADFSTIRYAQCWEDADILLPALDIQPGETCLAIASAGDNALAMLSQSPAKVIALDLSVSQLACLELRVAAYRELTHPELLTFIGSQNPGKKGSKEAQEISACRAQFYRRCRPHLSPEVQQFWDSHPQEIARGIGTAGKFERYFALFRDRLLPWVHRSDRIDELLAGGCLETRQVFYREKWNTWRWQLLFRVFFSRFVMGRLGRDPSFFQYVEGTVADRILNQTAYALTELNPAENPYLQWILKGYHTTALPYALRPENFAAIRDNLHRLEWHCCAVESFLDRIGESAIDAYNLSDIFEYMSPDNYHQLLSRLIKSGRGGARLVYWNMLVPRQRPEFLSDRLRSLDKFARELHRKDKAFFYSNFIVEEIV